MKGKRTLRSKDSFHRKEKDKFRSKDSFHRKRKDKFRPKDPFHRKRKRKFRLNDFCMEEKGTFRLINSFPPTGADDVPRTEAGLIQLRFSQDVVSNPKVWEYNKKQIKAFRNTLRIPIRVRRNLSCPNFIFVLLDAPLLQNTHYKVVVLPKLISTCGNKLGTTEVVFFDTGPCVTIPR